MSFDVLFQPAEQLDHLLEGLFAGATLPVALLVAFLLGLRHASDPDHLVAVTSLVAAEGGDTRKAAGLGAWWGLGHAASLLALGIPLIAFKAQLPAWLESGAEKGIGIVILALAARVIFKWARGDYRATAHDHERRALATPAPAARRRDAAIVTCESAAADRRSRSACSTASPAPAPWCSS